MTNAAVEMPRESPSEQYTEETMNAPSTGVSEVKNGPDTGNRTAKDNPRETVQHHENGARDHLAGNNSNQHSSERGSQLHSPEKRKPNHSKNVKSSYDDLPTSDDPVAIRKQVEFYFSDSNLGSDKFLYTQVGGAENNAVPLEIIHSFKRMRRFQPLSAVVAALKESSVLDIVDDDSAIKRKNPLPDDFKNKSYDDVRQVVEDATMARSIYAKGFGEEKPSTQFDIEAFFSSYGMTNQVRLRRDYTKAFKGSVFVEFDSEDTQKKFLDLDPQPTYHGQKLIIKSKKQYCDDKVADINAGKVRRNESSGKGGRGRGGFRDHRSDKDDGRDWRERRDEDRKKAFRNDRNRRGRGGSNGRGRGSGGRDGEHVGGSKDEANTVTVSNVSTLISTPDIGHTEKNAESEARNIESSKKRDREDQPVAEEDVPKKKQKEDSGVA